MIKDVIIRVGAGMAERNLGRLARALKASPRGPAGAGSAVPPGVYALFLRHPKALPRFVAGDDALLYVGMTMDAHGKRNHFDPSTGNSGFSSPRRSLGAVLKEHLGLHAIPRSAGRSSTNRSHYRFSDEGEAALSRWMRRNLAMTHVPLPADRTRIQRVEKQLIAYLKPPLNLTGFPGGANRRKLKQLRKICSDEARSVGGDRR